MPKEVEANQITLSEGTNTRKSYIVSTSSSKITSYASTYNTDARVYKLDKPRIVIPRGRYGKS